MVQIILLISLALFTISIAIALLRMIKGPTAADRAVALDMVGVNLISIIAVVSIVLKTKAFLEAILILGILAFISTIAVARYIERGVIIERKSDT